MGDMAYGSGFFTLWLRTPVPETHKYNASHLYLYVKNLYEYQYLHSISKSIDKVKPYLHDNFSNDNRSSPEFRIQRKMKETMKRCQCKQLSRRTCTLIPPTNFAARVAKMT